MVALAEAKNFFAVAIEPPRKWLISAGGRTVLRTLTLTPGLRPIAALLDVFVQALGFTFLALAPPFPDRFRNLHGCLPRLAPSCGQSARLGDRSLAEAKPSLLPWPPPSDG